MDSHGTMKVTSLNGVKVYTLSDQRAVPSWLPPSKLKAFQKNDDYTRRVDLLQDLTFESAATRIKATPDGECIIVSGIYPPQVKVYEVRELSLKFERHLDAEILEFQILGDDYSKLAFLCSDRSVWLHAKYGSHHQLRIPRMGRDLAYNCWSADLLVAASSPELYRINLEQGQFLAPISTRSPAINTVGRSPVHGLLACGGEDGALECFDLRQKVPAGRIDAVGPAGNGNQEVTALRFDENEGFLLAVGTSLGQVLLYDLRASTPIHIKDHMYGRPILDLKWHESLANARRHIISADNQIVRIWVPETGEAMTNVQPTAGEINDVCVIRNSGLIFMALDCPRIPAYFIPALGPAPRWCSYLENLTEELEEEGHNIIYDNFKFVTHEDLERINLTNLIGTNLLHAYMHGFFMDYRLYNKAKAMADPFAYETYRRLRIQEKLDAERAARITIKKKLPKVNRKLAERLLAGIDENAEMGDVKTAGRRTRSHGSDLLEDDRFKAMFIDEAFQVDEESTEYKLLHPNAKKTKIALLQEHFNPVFENDSDPENVSHDTSERNNRQESSEESSASEELVLKKRRKPKSDSKNVEKDGMASQSSEPRFYEVKDEIHAQAFRNRVSLAAEHALPLEERIANAGRKSSVDSHGYSKQKFKGHGGGREISFRTGHRDASIKPSRHKRGVQSLGLRSVNSKNFGRGRSNHGSKGKRR